MLYSLNQIEHTCRKAARGAGLPWGIAEDTGRSVRWLQTMRLDGPGLLLSLLSEHEETNWADCQVRVEDGIWIGENSTLSPLLAGPSISDMLDVSADESAAIRIGPIRFPALLLGFAGIAAGQRDCEVVLEFDQMSVVCGQNEFHLSGDRNLLSAKEVNSVLVYARGKSCDETRSVQSGHIGAHAVPADTWMALENLAHITYVEATEASRLAGAGAGLNDND